MLKWASIEPFIKFASLASSDGDCDSMAIYRRHLSVHYEASVLVVVI